MSHNRLKHCFPVALVASALLAGCASSGPASFADRLNAEGARAVELAATWEEGEELARDGESLIRKGDRRASKGEDLLTRGQRLVRDGQERIALQRAAYAAASISFGSAGTPEQLEKELKVLETIAGDWSDALRDVSRGEALVEEGRELLDRGTTEAREGRQMIVRGQELMRGAESAYDSEVRGEMPQHNR